MSTPRAFMVGSSALVYSVVATVVLGPFFSASVSAQSTSAERGAQVFAASKCTACHSVAGKGNAKGVLDSVGTRLSGADIREWIVNAPAMTAKTKAQRKPPMRAFTQLAPDDVDALVTYLLSLK